MKRVVILLALAATTMMTLLPRDAIAHGWWRSGCGYRSYGYSGWGYGRSYYPSYSYCSPRYGYYGGYNSYQPYGAGYGMPSSYGFGNFGGGYPGGAQWMNVLGSGTLGQASYVSIPVGVGYGPPGYLQIPVGGGSGRATFMQVPMSMGFGPATYLQFQVGGSTTATNTTPTPTTVAPPFGFSPGPSGAATDQLTLDDSMLFDIDTPPIAVGRPRSSADMSSFVNNGGSGSAPQQLRSPFQFAVQRTTHNESQSLTSASTPVGVDVTGPSTTTQKASTSTGFSPVVDLGPSFGMPSNRSISEDETVPWVAK